MNSSNTVDSVNCYKIQTPKRFKRTLIIATKHNLQTFGVITFVKLENDT